MGFFDKLGDIVTKPFDWAGDILGGAGDKIGGMGQTGYRAPEPAAPTYYSMPQNPGRTIAWSSPFGGSSQVTIPGGTRDAPQYSAPRSDFWANPTYSNYWAQAHYNGFESTPWARAQRSEMSAIDPYYVNYMVNAPQGFNYSPAIQAAMSQLIPGHGAAQDTIMQQQQLADVLRAQMRGEGPSLAQAQLQAATQQNMAQAFGAMQGASGMNSGLAARTALNQTAGQNQAAAFQSGVLRQQEQLGAQSQLAGLLDQTGNLQLGQQQAATGLLGTAGGLAAQQDAFRMQAQLANQQTAFKNADMYQAAMTLNEQLAARNLQAAMQTQGLIANVHQQNTDMANRAIALNQQTSLANAGFANQATALNAQTSIANAGFQAQTNQTNAGAYANWLNNWTANNGINAGLQNNWLNNQTARYNINAGIKQGNAQQEASNWGGLFGAASALPFIFLNKGGEVPSYSGGGIAGLLGGGGGGGGGIFGQIAPGIMKGMMLGDMLKKRREQNSEPVGMGFEDFLSQNPSPLGIPQLQIPTGLGMPYEVPGYAFGGPATVTFGNQPQPMSPMAQSTTDGSPVERPLNAPRPFAGRPPFSRAFQGVGASPFTGMFPGNAYPAPFGGGVFPGNASPAPFTGVFPGSASPAPFSSNPLVNDPRAIGFMNPTFNWGRPATAQPAQPTLPPPAMSPYTGGASPFGAANMGGDPWRALARAHGVNFSQGGMTVVPGQPLHPGQDVPENDTVLARLTPGEIVLPLSVTQAENAPERAKAFVAAISAKKSEAPRGYAGMLAKKKMAKDAC